MSAGYTKFLFYLFLSTVLLHCVSSNFAIGRLSPNRPSAGKRSSTTDHIWKSILLQTEGECSLVRRLLLREEVERIQVQLVEMMDMLDQCQGMAPKTA